MNWILLILAGCLELVFTFCLMCEYAASDKGDQDIAGWYGLCDMDRHRCGGHGINRYFLL